MARREESWWSRAWGFVAVAAFAVHLGAAVYEAAVVAPLWSLTPPASVVAWMSLDRRPDSSALFYPLTATITAAAAMAWVFGLTTRGWRRWWLTLSLGCAGALAFVTLIMMMPVERMLSDAVARGDAPRIVALTGDWMRAAAFRLLALALGSLAAYRAQLAGRPAASPVEFDRDAPAGDAEEDAFVISGPRAAPEFSFGDEDEPAVALGDELPNPRQRWRGSLPKRRRTAKK